ncbi:beta-galactosidase [Salmonella enterica subsp. enterica serovar Saintpaul]|nr:beta-galactosidase [Salmonella enterica subsp. enterica serovar Saintpaul]
MGTFTVDKNLLQDGKPVQIISGAIHYFRLVPQYWEHSLNNLKALGANCVETYLPWNIHQPAPDRFCFTGMADIERFIALAQRKGLFVILRPSPYICAEWEFGGLPAWLLRDPSLRVRSSQPAFLQAVERYYAELLPRLVPWQYDRGGPVVMMQLENEYGSFGNDKAYLRALSAMMRQYGVTVPLFTSDGAWREALQAGSLCNDNVLATANFGSRSAESLDNLDAFQPERPLMCMEFWNGWFNRYGDAIIRRDAEDVGQEISTLLTRASVNIYMFQGGTNFGFMNGCSVRSNKDLPQVTSYDYDALLSEWGEPGAKFFAVQRAIHQHAPETEQSAPVGLLRRAYGTIALNRKVSLFATLPTLSHPVKSPWPLTMEEVGQNYGYILYRCHKAGPGNVEKCRVVDASDRVQFYCNGQHLATQYHEQIGEQIPFTLRESDNVLDLLIENMGRVNYGPRLLSPTQRKGLRGGLVIDLHLEADWDIYPLPLDNIEDIDFSAGWQPQQPAFYEYRFAIDNPADTFLDTRSLGKGVAFINGFNLGRYWHRGPLGYLYIPAPLLRQGENRLVIFETEGIDVGALALLDEPVYIEVTESTT